ncbi:GntR family transcriptional regulator [Botrimarina sp.]|uniref:GntR family transcriptional regulator n=1 Tax=Botrimarina sp. TaxID=2795802 RepID=UPI0032EF5A33
MFLRVNPTNGVAVYDQIARQVKFAVADGALAPGELIPSVRELARELAVNPNTVARAYRDLQSDGVVETAPGVGLAVCEGARRACRAERRSLLKERVQAALREVADAGLAPDEIESLVLGELERVKKQASQRRGSP